MANYHFNVRGETIDREGTEFANLSAAQLAAIQMTGAVLSSARKVEDANWRVTVTDDGGQTLFGIEVVLSAAQSAKLRLA